MHCLHTFGRSSSVLREKTVLKLLRRRSPVTIRLRSITFVLNVTVACFFDKKLVLSVSYHEVV